MKFSKSHLFAIAIIIASFAVGIYYYPQMPAQVASHWNIHGQADGYMSKFWGTFLMPIISIVLYLLFLIIPAIDPKRNNIVQFRAQFNTFIAIIFAFLFYIYLITIAWNLGHHYNFGQVLAPAFAVLFYYSGVLISNAKPNYFIGIRTPWTLASDEVWTKTHKIGAKLFKLSALLCLVGLFCPAVAFYFVIIPVIASAIYIFVYSYWEFEKITKKRNNKANQ